MYACFYGRRGELTMGTILRNIVIALSLSVLTKQPLQSIQNIAMTENQSSDLLELVLPYKQVHDM